MSKEKEFLFENKDKIEYRNLNDRQIDIIRDMKNAVEVFLNQKWIQFHENFCEPTHVFRVRSPEFLKVDGGISLNHNEGKPDSLLVLKDMQYAFSRVVESRVYGSKKYDRMNFIKSKGTKHEAKFLEDNLSSIQRHLMAVISGENIDKESNIEHLALIINRCMIGLMYQKDSVKSDQGSCLNEM